MRKAFSIVFLFLTALAFAQNAGRQLESTACFGDRLELVTNDGRYIIRSYSDKIMETCFIPKGEAFTAGSHAVVMLPEKVPAKLKEKGAYIEYATSGIKATIQRSPFKISYSYKGKPLLSEKEGYIKKDSTEVLAFNLDASEALYGGGARALGMDRRGNRLRLYNKAHYGYGDRSELMNFTMPLVLSSKIYAVHFDNAQIGYLDLDSKRDSTLSYETIGGRKVYQVIAGDSWQDLIGSYTGLTGKQPMLPRWALGNFASRFGYHSEKETRTVVDKFRAESIPLDAVVLDLYWFGRDIQGTMGNLEFYRDSFPAPEKMIADFRREGIKTVLITEPFILTTSTRWEEAKDKKVLASDKKGIPYTYDFYFGNTGLIDVFDPKAASWFWNIYRTYNNMGVAGWWGDLGEPEVHPSYVRHATGTADEVHNIYGHRWARLVYEGYKKDFPEQRPFILMRSGYSGSQRYGMVPWSGDVGRSWEGLRAQPEISLQMGMQGMGYMHSDLGGFAGDNVDDELYVRWLQYGVFQPIFRPHAQESVPPEAVFRKPEVKKLAAAAIALRYKMLPYNYTLTFRNNKDGLPLMHPLLFEEPDNRKVQSVSDEYLWGDAFLVAPVTAPGIREREVYFPATGNWFDFTTWEKQEGGTTKTIAVAQDHIPVFVRGGSFIPMLPEVIQSTEEYTTKKLIVYYMHDEAVKESSGMLYDDDGHTPEAYEKGKYELLKFRSRVKGKKLEIHLEAETGRAQAPQDREITFVIPGPPGKERSVKINWNSKKTEKIILPID